MAATEITTPSNEDRFTQAMELVAQTQQAILANQPRKHMSVADYTAKHQRPAMPCTVFQNGMHLDNSMVSDEQIALLKHLKPGKFLNRLVTVHRDTSASDMPWFITYNCKTADQRITLASAIRGDFTELLRRITTDDPIVD